MKYDSLILRSDAGSDALTKGRDNGDPHSRTLQDSAPEYFGLMLVHLGHEVLVLESLLVCEHRRAQSH